MYATIAFLRLGLSSIVLNCDNQMLRMSIFDWVMVVMVITVKVVIILLVMVTKVMMV